MVALALFMDKGRWEGNNEREGEGDVRGIDPGGKGSLLQYYLYCLFFAIN